MSGNVTIIELGLQTYSFAISSCHVLVSTCASARAAHGTRNEFKAHEAGNWNPLPTFS
jgi:hypothetical protein